MLKHVHITDIQEQIIIGAVLGGCSLIKQPKGKNYYLSMRSSDCMWLKYKMAELYNCFQSTEFSCQVKTYRCNTICLEELSYFYKLLYKDGKRYASSSILEKLRDIGLAIWFIETGGWAGRNRKNAYINTTLLGLESSYIVENYFNSLHGINCKLHIGKNRMKVLFSVPSSEKLMKIILPKYPNYLIQKIEREGLTS